MNRVHCRRVEPIVTRPDPPSPTQSPPSRPADRTTGPPSEARTGPVPAVSVVVPAYNEEESVAILWGEIAEALDGAAIPYEAILVDDGSTDRTPETLRELAAADPAVRMIRQRPTGASRRPSPPAGAPRGRRWW